MFPDVKMSEEFDEPTWQKDLPTDRRELCHRCKFFKPNMSEDVVMLSTLIGRQEDLTRRSFGNTYLGRGYGPLIAASTDDYFRLLEQRYGSDVVAALNALKEAQEDAATIKKTVEDTKLRDKMIRTIAVLGTCRRYPPRTNSDSKYGYWPRVESSEFCGEYRTREDLKVRPEPGKEPF